ncbi:MAG: hypothetical protein ABFC57_16830 [Veillonellales bacterium]
MLETSIIIVAALLIGYILGKHYGYQQGNREGQVSMGLLLRQKSLEQGQCALCQQLFDDNNAGMEPNPPVDNSLQEGS